MAGQLTTTLFHDVNMKNVEALEDWIVLRYPLIGFRLASVLADTVI